jgi:class 3 adenylate cyclase
MADKISDIRDELARGELTLFVGAGVSMAATCGESAASWSGLLEAAIDASVEYGGASQDWVNIRRLQLKQGEFVSAAEEITQKLRGRSEGEYAKFLKDTVGSLRVKNNDLLSRILAINAPIVTTNYDDILCNATGLRPITWREPTKFQRFVKSENNGILHLHGHWEDPESIILGIRSYEEIIKDEKVQNALRNLVSTRTILFVGFGRGLADPNFGALRRWIRNVLSSSVHCHYCLVEATHEDLFQDLSDPNGRILPVRYESNAVLPELLDLLISPTGKTVPNTQIKAHTSDTYRPQASDLATRGIESISDTSVDRSSRGGSMNFQDPHSFEAIVIFCRIVGIDDDKARTVRHKLEKLHSVVVRKLEQQRTLSLTSKDSRLPTEPCSSPFGIFLFVEPNSSRAILIAGEVRNECASADVPVAIGVARGEITKRADLGSVNYVGSAINIAARLANVRDGDNRIAIEKEIVSNAAQQLHDESDFSKEQIRTVKRTSIALRFYNPQTKSKDAEVSSAVDGHYHVVVYDIVGYSEMQSDVAWRSTTDLNQAVKRILDGQNLSTEHYDYAPAGDGGAIAFRANSTRATAKENAVSFANNLINALNRPRSSYQFKVRVGITEGVVAIHNENPVGPAVINADRLCAHAKENGIACNKEYYDRCLRDSTSLEIENDELVDEFGNKLVRLRPSFL